MNKQNYFDLQNDDGSKNQQIDKRMRGLQKVGDIIEQDCNFILKMLVWRCSYSR
jgi:hypothetical protein